MSSENLIVEFELETLADILLAVRFCDVEISGLARVSREGDRFKVYGGAMIFKQECSLHITEPTIKPYNMWCNNAISSQGEEGIKEVLSHKLWWHSHVWAGVYFSPTDTGTMVQLLSGFSEWWLALVMNKYYEKRIVLIERDEKGKRMRPASISKIYTPELRRLMELRADNIRKEVKEKVTILESNKK